MEFIKCENIIVNVSEIKTVRTHDQYLFIECRDKEYNIYFNSESEAKHELYRIYEVLTTIPDKEQL